MVALAERKASSKCASGVSDSDGVEASRSDREQLVASAVNENRRRSAQVRIARCVRIHARMVEMAREPWMARTVIASPGQRRGPPR